MSFNKIWLFSFCSLFFYLFLFKLCKYFFSKIDNNNVWQPEEKEDYIRHDWLIAVIIYCFCIILFFYPCLRNIAYFLIGPPEDNMQHFWDIWWMRKALSEPHINLSFSNYVYYPEGTPLLFHAFSFYNLFLSFILIKFFNPVLTYNLCILHTFLISGMGAFFLIRYLIKNSFLALIGGFIFAFNPSHFAHALHHIGLASIQFVPFFVLFFIKAIRSNSKSDLFWACLFFFLNSISEWNYLVFAIYFMMFIYLYLMYRRRQIFLKDILIKSGIIIGITSLILSPWLLRMISVGLRHPEIIESGHNVYVADTVALFSPDPYHWLARFKIVKSVNARFTGNDWEKTVYLGIFNIFIVLIAFRRIIKKTAQYFLGFFASLIISLGVSLHILGYSLPIVLPYALIKHIPFLSQARCPSRFIVYAYLFLAMIVALALKHLIFSCKSMAKKISLSIVFIILLFLDYYSACTVMNPAYLPACYGTIKKEEKTFGILNLPFNNYVDRERYMLYQTYHGFPIVEGFISRKVGTSLMDRLELKDLQEQRNQLIENNVKYIVIHKLLLSKENQLDIQQQYTQYYETIYQDEENIVLGVY